MPILRTPVWARPICPYYLRLGLWGVDLVTTWHHVPVFGIYLTKNDGRFCVVGTRLFNLLGDWKIGLLWRLLKVGVRYPKLAQKR